MRQSLSVRGLVVFCVAMCSMLGGCKSTQTEGVVVSDSLFIGMSYKEAKRILAKHGRQRIGYSLVSMEDHAFNDCGDDVFDPPSFPGMKDAKLISRFVLNNGMNMALRARHSEARDDVLGYMLIGMSVSARTPHDEKFSCRYAFTTAQIRDERVIMEGLSPLVPDEIGHEPVFVHRGMDRQKAEAAIRKAGGVQYQASTSAVSAMHSSRLVRYKMPSVKYSNATVDGSPWIVAWSLEMHSGATAGQEWITHLSVKIDNSSKQHLSLGDLYADLVAKIDRYDIVDLRDPLCYPTLQMVLAKAQPGSPGRTKGSPLVPRIWM